MIKDILVNASIRNAPDRTVDYAVALAGLCEAHLTAVAFAYDPAIVPSMTADIPSDYIDSLRAESEAVARTALTNFEETARKAGIQIDSRAVNGSFASAATVFGQMARRFDLSVLAQSEPDTPGPEDLLIESALFESGRPVLIVPYIQESPIKLDRVMVCWDASRNAARAIGDALPLLRRAKAIDVIVVATDGGSRDELPGADIATHLARHGLRVNLQRIVAVDVDVPSTILSQAADSGADLIVMGGYGHSRLREFVLGGATRGVLSAMTVPTLMAH